MQQPCSEAERPSRELCDCGSGIFCSRDPVFKPLFAVWLSIFVPGDKWKVSKSPLCCDSVQGEGDNLFPIKVSFGLETKEKRAVCWLSLADREPVTDQLINTEGFKYTVSQKKKKKAFENT